MFFWQTILSNNTHTPNTSLPDWRLTGRQVNYDFKMAIAFPVSIKYEAIIF